MWSFPASFMAEFFENHGMYSLRDRPAWRTVSGGSNSYVEAISAPWRERVRLSAPVRRIERHPGRVRIEADGCESEDFDQVVIATHSDQALALLADPSRAEREILGAIPYQPNEAVLHTDASLMPRRRAVWSSWNFHLAEGPPRGSTVTYWMNNLQRLDADREYFVTLNRGDEIDPEKTIRPLRLRPPDVHRRGRRRPGPPRRGQRRAPHPLLRRLLGLGLPRGRRRQRDPRLRRDRARSEPCHPAAPRRV